MTSVSFSPCFKGIFMRIFFRRKEVIRLVYFQKKSKSNQENASSGGVP